MCGRFAFYSPREVIVRVFGLPEDTPDVAPRWNVAPTQPVAAVRARPDGRRELVLLRWGLIPSWAPDRSIGHRLINARAESLATKPAFRAAYRKRRCLVLADGYYEWRVLPGGRGKQPYYVRPRDGTPMGLAGLWESWRDAEAGAEEQSCVIVTTDAVDTLREIHERMPVAIPQDRFAEWLDPARDDVAALDALLAAAQGAELVTRPVSVAVNSPRNEGPELLKSPGGDARHGP